MEDVLIAVALFFTAVAVIGLNVWNRRYKRTLTEAQRREIEDEVSPW